MSDDNGSTDAPPAQQTGDTPPAGPDLAAEVEKWKALARKHEGTAKANVEAAKKLADIEAANQSEVEKAVSAARKEAEDSVRAEVRRERVLDRVEVLAAKEFADPEDARLRLEKRADEFVDKDGGVDAAAIGSALAQLLKDKPHLAAKTDGRPRGNADQGPRGSAPVDPGPGVARMRAAYATRTS